MSNFKRFFSFVYIALILGFYIVPITNLFGHIKSSDTNQVFRRGNYDEPDTLDPQKAFAVPDYNILHDLYEGLMTFDQDGKVTLGQAKSYDVSSDGKTYQFYLKDNLRWSNGEELTAYDFEFGIKRAVDPKIGSQNFILLKAIKNSSAISDGKLSVDELGVKALDNKTLIIELEYPLPYLKSLLTHNSFMPIYRPNLNKYGDDFTRPDIYVTNGPFKLIDWVVNSHVTLQKNDYYINSDSVKLNKVIFYSINQPSVELKSYRSGDIDYTAKIPLDSINWLQKNMPNDLHANRMLAAYYYTFNVTKPPFNNKKLRKALSFAINKEIIAKKLIGGNRIAVDNFVPFGIDNYIQINKKDALNYNVELAKKYYKEAGYNNHHKPKFKLLYHTNESNKVIAIAVASMWKKVFGIETELVNQEWKVFLKSRLNLNETEVFREGWIASYNDPVAFLELFMSNNPQNSSGYYNPNYDSLLLKAKFESDLSNRAKLLLEAENILLDDVPVIPIYSPQSYHLIKSYVGGIFVNIFDVTLSRYVYIKPNK